MVININGENQHCHRCGSEDLEVINITTDGDSYLVWCNSCEEETLEDHIKLDKVKGINFCIDGVK